MKKRMLKVIEKKGITFDDGFTVYFEDIHEQKDLKWQLKTN